MAMTIAERRKKDRERKARQRVAAAEEQVPSAGMVVRAIVEANAFALAGVNIGRPVDERSTMVDMNLVVRVALKILCKRHSYDFEKSKAMVMAALAPRPEHSWPSYVPTWAQSIQSDRHAA